jgi:hypothetical protein
MGVVAPAATEVGAAVAPAVESAPPITSTDALTTDEAADREAAVKHPE